MPHSNTQFDRAQIEATATRHTDLVANVDQQLNQLRGEVQATMAGSSNDMTTALTQVYESWQSNVKKVVLENLNLMAESMRAEANNQEMQDTDNTRAITNTQTAVGSFLAG